MLICDLFVILDWVRFGNFFYDFSNFGQWWLRARGDSYMIFEGGAGGVSPPWGPKLGDPLLRLKSTPRPGGPKFLVFIPPHIPLQGKFFSSSSYPPAGENFFTPRRDNPFYPPPSPPLRSPKKFSPPPYTPSKEPKKFSPSPKPKWKFYKGVFGGEGWCTMLFHHFLAIH